MNLLSILKVLIKKANADNDWHDGCSFLNGSKFFRRYLLYVSVYHIELCGENSSANKNGAAPRWNRAEMFGK